MTQTIPDGYLTVGEAAEKMNISVRTLQYYDQQGLLTPSSTSAGGRRLYTYKDLVLLHQILSLKHLGFSLKEIKEHLVTLETADEVAAALEHQARQIRKQIEVLNDTLQNVEALRNEVLEMETVDFKRYADIVVNLEMRNDLYWMLKHFDSETLDALRSRFDHAEGTRFMTAFSELMAEARRHLEMGTDPTGNDGQNYARRFWSMVQNVTNGDKVMLQKMLRLGQDSELQEEWTSRSEQSFEFIGPALGAYFENLGIDPFEEAT